MTVGVFLPYVPPGTRQSRPRSGTNGLQEAGLQGRICSFLLSFIYSDALSLYRLRFSVEWELISLAIQRDIYGGRAHDDDCRQYRSTRRFDKWCGAHRRFELS